MPIHTEESQLYMQREDGELVTIGNLGSVEINLEPASFEGSVDLDNIRNAQCTKWEIPLDIDLCIKRLVATIINPKLGRNNWRKMHGLPMWRS